MKWSRETRAIISGSSGHSFDWHSLQVVAFCRWHRRRYQANERVNGAVQAVDCPDCCKEREWIRKAHAEMGAEIFQDDPGAVVLRAQDMAGFPFRRYSTKRKGET